MQEHIDVLWFAPSKSDQRISFPGVSPRWRMNLSMSLSPLAKSR